MFESTAYEQTIKFRTAGMVLMPWLLHTPLAWFKSHDNVVFGWASHLTVTFRIDQAQHEPNCGAVVCSPLGFTRHCAVC